MHYAVPYSAQTLNSVSVEILTEPALYFASELDEAIQGSDWDEETVVVTSVSSVLYWAV